MSSLIRIEPASADRWDDLERLFGARGACGGCWCMWYRLPRAEYERQKGAGNREELRRLLGAGQPVGVIAYAGEEPIGWCAVAPRAAFTRLERARTIPAVFAHPGVPSAFLSAGFTEVALPEPSHHASLRRHRMTGVPGEPQRAVGDPVQGSATTNGEPPSCALSFCAADWAC